MKLSPRERHIVACLQQGQTNKQIGRALGLSQYTVRDNISPMLARYGVESRAALVASLVRNAQLVTQPSVQPDQHCAERRTGCDRRSAPRGAP